MEKLIGKDTKVEIFFDGFRATGYESGTVRSGPPGFCACGHGQSLHASVTSKIIAMGARCSESRARWTRAHPRRRAIILSGVRERRWKPQCFPRASARAGPGASPSNFPRRPEAARCAKRSRTRPCDVGPSLALAWSLRMRSISRVSPHLLGDEHSSRRHRSDSESFRGAGRRARAG